MLYETMRNYFAVNSSGQMSQLYIYLACIIQPMWTPWTSYVSFRMTEALIANCAWQIGQLTNVLNYLFDNVLKRIYITQNSASILSDPMFQYPPVNFDSDFLTAPPQQFERVFDDPSNVGVVTINAPASISLTALTAVIEQIRVSGIPYNINQF